MTSCMHTYTLCLCTHTVYASTRACTHSLCVCVVTCCTPAVECPAHLLGGVVHPLVHGVPSHRAPQGATRDTMPSMGAPHHPQVGGGRTQHLFTRGLRRGAGIVSDTTHPEECVKAFRRPLLPQDLHTHLGPICRERVDTHSGNDSIVTSIDKAEVLGVFGDHPGEVLSTSWEVW